MLIEAIHSRLQRHTSTFRWKNVELSHRPWSLCTFRSKSGLQNVTRFFLNSPDGLYIKKSYEFLQSYEKKRAEQKEFILFLCRVPSKFATLSQSYEKTSKLQNRYFEQELAIKSCMMGHKISHREQYFP